MKFRKEIDENGEFWGVATIPMNWGSCEICKKPIPRVHC